MVGQRLLADVVQQAGGVHDRALAVRQPGDPRQLVRVARDGGGMTGGARVAQRQRLEQQREHPLVADVELVVAALDLLAVGVALQQRAQQQLADAERDAEEPDHAGAVELEAPDGHRGDRRGRELPGEHRQVDRAEELLQRAAAQPHGVAGDHREVEDVRPDEHGEDDERVATAAERRRPVHGHQQQAAEQRERRVRREVVEEVGAARARAGAEAVDGGRGQAERDGGRRPERRHRQHDPEERSADAEALGVQDDEVRAEHEHGEQADHRQRRPLVGIRDEHRDADGDRQQHALGDHGRAPAALARHRRPVQARTRLRGRRAAVAERQGRAFGVVGAGRAHERERPGDDDEPQDDGEPDDHSPSEGSGRRRFSPGVTPALPRSGEAGCGVRRARTAHPPLIPGGNPQRALHPAWQRLRGRSQCKVSDPGPAPRSRFGDTSILREGVPWVVQSSRRVAMSWRN